jgi:hypothetical protein
VRRRRADEWDDPELDALIQSQCFSCWEGCCCQLPKGHDGLHECVVGCPEKWTDEQERQFMESMK